IDSAFLGPGADSGETTRGRARWRSNRSGPWASRPRERSHRVAPRRLKGWGRRAREERAIAPMTRLSTGHTNTKRKDPHEAQTPLWRLVPRVPRGVDRRRFVA